MLAGYRRAAGERERKQARPFGVSDLGAVLATRDRRGGAARRGVESDQVAVAALRVRPNCEFCTDYGPFMRGFVVGQRLQAIQAAAGKSPKVEQSVSRTPSTVRRAAATVLDSCYVAWEPGSGRRRSDPVDGCGS